MSHPKLKNFRRIVVKVGSSLLIDSAAGEVRANWLAALAADIAKLHHDGKDVLVVSSGSIALGRSRLKLPAGALKLEESQAAAAVGQIELARIWSEVLGAHSIGAGQILVTLQDTEERRRYLNARSTISKLLEWRAVPVINENDTVATNEIRYGDNDRLRRPRRHHDQRGPPHSVVRHRWALHCAAVRQSECEADSGRRIHHCRCRGDGRCGRIRTVARRHAHQDRGREDRNLRWHPHADCLRQDRASLAGHRRRRPLHMVSHPANPVTARKRWIAGSLEPKGTLTMMRARSQRSAPARACCRPA